MAKTIFRNNALEVMRTALNPDLKNIPDEDLVSLAQEDIDLYRNECDWICPSCGSKVSYSESIESLGVHYIHELKCSDIVSVSRKIEDPKCRHAMNVFHRSDSNFDSLYFNELFARYQDRIIAESTKCGTTEDPYDVYAILSGFFMKVIGKFARKSSFTKKSDSWFSSYFWRAIRNKTTDIRKTETYSKRSPMVRCPICEKDIGNINTKHLLLPGHEIISCTFFEEMGISVLEDSGEINFYGEGMELTQRALFLGKRRFLSLDRAAQKSLSNAEYLRIFNRLFPGTVTKNMVFSTNEIAYAGGDSSSEIEFEDNCVDENSVCAKNNNPKELQEIVNHLVEDCIVPNVWKFKKFFKEDVDLDRRIQIINEIIFDKSSYNMTDKELDIDYKDEVKKGLSSTVFKFMRKKKEAKDFLIFKSQVS